LNIWITKNSEVPVRDQLILQVILGIAGGDLNVAEKMPSTREIARRFQIHSNTVSAAYQKLVASEMLEYRKGSGYFVKSAAGDIAGRQQKLTSLIKQLLVETRRLGFADQEVANQFKQLLKAGKSTQIRLIEPDRDLRDILEFELRSAGFDVESSGFEFLNVQTSADGEILVAMFDERQRIEASHFPPGDCIYLRGRSVAASLSSESRPAEHDMISVVSGWDGFLSMAKILLLAAKIQPGNLIVRSTKTEGWLESAKTASIIVSDSLTASKMADGKAVKVFNVISDDSIDEIKRALNR